MDIEDTKLYTSGKAYFEGPDGMNNEVTMWYVAAGLLMREVAKRKGGLPFGGLGDTAGYTIKPGAEDSIDLLDLCSGPGNFANHLSFVFPWLHITCVDKNKTLLDAGRALFHQWTFIQQDVTALHLEKTFDCVTASSAYHHMKDPQKLSFLGTIKKHLAKNGFAIICENFLPAYGNKREKLKAIGHYYRELKKYYRNGNATRNSMKAIDEVRQLERAGVEEYKVSYSFFENQLAKSGLSIESDVIVWQPDSFKSSNAGSHVLVLTRG